MFQRQPAIRERKVEADCKRCGSPFLAFHKRTFYCDPCYFPAISDGLKASHLVNKAVRKGQLKPARECECVDCGAPAKVYEHRSYDKPLDVVPVCFKCNSRRGAAVRNIPKTRLAEASA